MRARLAVACGLLAAACGRVRFDARGDAAPSDTNAVAGAVHYGGVIAGEDDGMTATTTFTASAASAGDGVLIYFGCQAMTQPTSLTVTTPLPWSLTAIVPLFGDATVQMYGAAYFANAPDTNAVTVTVTSDVTCYDMIELADDFAAEDGTVTVDDESAMAASGTCQVAANAHHDGVTVWSACVASTVIGATGGGFSKGADDGVGDWSEYRETTDPAGTNEASSFALPSGPYSAVIVTLAAL